MNPIDFLERRFSRFAIPGLVRNIVIVNMVVYMLSFFSPPLLGMLDLNPDAIRQGQLWRLVTYIFIPNYGGIFTALFNQPGNVVETVLSLLCLWMIGDSLESVWGTFRLNLFYLLGMLGTTVAAFAFGAGFSNGMLNLSLLFAFAWYFPDFKILLFYVLPVKVKWLAWYAAGTLLLRFILLNSLEYRMAVIVSLANFLLFFGPEIVSIVRRRRGVANRRSAFAKASVPEDEPLHRCVTCQRSDVSHPELEFRVARDGNDYCTEHLPKPATQTT